MKLIARLLALAAMSLALIPAGAADWQPSKPIKIIVAFAPGGSADALVRLLQPSWPRN